MARARQRRQPCLQDMAGVDCRLTPGEALGEAGLDRFGQLPGLLTYKSAKARVEQQGGGFGGLGGAGAGARGTYSGRGADFVAVAVMVVPRTLDVSVPPPSSVFARWTLATCDARDGAAHSEEFARLVTTLISSKSDR